MRGHPPHPWLAWPPPCRALPAAFESSEEPAAVRTQPSLVRTSRRHACVQPCGSAADASVSGGASGPQRPSSTKQPTPRIHPILAVRSRSDGPHEAQGWTVFQIPSTRSVSETPSTPGIAVGAASCSRRGTPEFPRSQTFPTFPRLRPDGLASAAAAAARTNTRLRRRPPRPGGEQKHAGRRLVPCLRRSVARSGGRAPFLVLGPRACPGA